MVMFTLCHCVHGGGGGGSNSPLYRGLALPCSHLNMLNFDIIVAGPRQTSPQHVQICPSMKHGTCRRQGCWDSKLIMHFLHRMEARTDSNWCAYRSLIDRISVSRLYPMHAPPPGGTTCLAGLNTFALLGAYHAHPL